MRQTRGLVADTVRTSFVDGPGNRYVLFLQGCNFDCLNCHNPHTINVCNSCGLCLEFCEPGSLSLGLDGVEFEPSLCTGCDRCLDACPFTSSPMVVGRGVEQVVADLVRCEAFLTGVTVSGGEPTQQLDFLCELFAAVKSHPSLQRLTTFVDSNGSLDPSGWQRMAPWLDGAMIDVKAVSPDLHRRITGHDNDAVLGSVRLLHALGKLHEIRLLVIPGVTDTVEELERYAGFVRSVDPTVRLVLNAFRHHGVRPAGREWPQAAAADVAAAAASLRAGGLGQVVENTGAVPA